jgi:hypothetical protein
MEIGSRVKVVAFIIGSKKKEKEILIGCTGVVTDIYSENAIQPKAYIRVKLDDDPYAKLPNYDNDPVYLFRADEIEVLP